MKAIQTVYKGYKFRSRLEARWAVFFDALGLDWEYEPEGYELPDGTWYLPDFFIPSANAWIEIKAGEATESELEKIHHLTEISGVLHCLIATGDIALIRVATNELLSKCFDMELPLSEAYEQLRTLLKETKNKRKSYVFDCGIDGNSTLCVNDKDGELKYITSKSEMAAYYLISTKSDDHSALLFAASSKKPDVIEFSNNVVAMIDRCKNKARQARFEHGETPL